MNDLALQLLRFQRELHATNVLTPGSDLDRAFSATIKRAAGEIVPETLETVRDSKKADKAKTVATVTNV